MNAKKQPPGRIGRRRERANGDPLTLDLNEAARHLGLSRRTLIGYLRRDGTALVELGGKRKVLRLDRKAFFKFCRRLGFEVGGVSHGS